MAQQVANAFQLPALVPRLVRRRKKDGDLLLLNLRLGHEEVARAEVALSDTGLPDEPDTKGLRHLNMVLPDDPAIAGLIETAGYILNDSQPVLWLHLPRNEPVLALFPWETVLGERLPPGSIVLRVPNFVEDPFLLGSRTINYAICASAPIAKGPYMLPPLICDALEELASEDTSHPLDVHVFTDLAACKVGRELIADCSKPEKGFRVIVHDPQEAAELDTPNATRHIDGAASQISNPWLKWMTGKMKGQPLDMVHFMAPGYLHRSEGALALAVSPLENDDPEWSRFVGAAELSRFLDELGVQGLGLHPIREDHWALGLRFLAWQMTWLRPGPVLSCRETYEAKRFRDLGYLHRILTRRADEKLEFSGAPFLNLHPKHLNADPQPLNIDHVVEAFTTLTGTGDGYTSGVEKNVLHRSMASSQRRLDTGTSTAGIEEYQSQDNPWLKQANRLIDTRRARMSSVGPKSRKESNQLEGTLDALDFVTDLLQKGGTSTGGTVQSLTENLREQKE